MYLNDLLISQHVMVFIYGKVVFIWYLTLCHDLVPGAANWLHRCILKCNIKIHFMLKVQDVVKA